MKEYIKDVEQSMALHEQYKEHISPNTCFCNIANVFFNTDLFFKNKNLKVCFGMVRRNNICFVHCFLLESETGQVIDFTIPKENENTYYVLIQLSKEEYINLMSEMNFSGLRNYLPLQNKFKLFCQWADEKRYYCLGSF